MAEQEKWQWQEPGTAWKGVGLYHFTMTIPSRQPMLGMLSIPDNNPTKALVYRTALGNALVNCLLSIPRYHPEVQVLHFCLMPDHIHAVLYVRHTMAKGIGTLARGFWQSSKKLGRAWSVLHSPVVSSLFPNGIRENCQEGSGSLQGASSGSPVASLAGSPVASLAGSPAASPAGSPVASPASSPVGSSSFLPNGIREKLKEETMQLEALSGKLREQMGDEAYYSLPSVFTEMPFIRPMGRRSQLQNTIRYIDMNPQRLATKRLKPGFFRVQQAIELGGRTYDGVGNTRLLLAQSYSSSTMVSANTTNPQRIFSMPVQQDVCLSSALGFTMPANGTSLARTAWHLTLWQKK